MEFPVDFTPDQENQVQGGFKNSPGRRMQDPNATFILTLNISTIYDLVFLIYI